MGYYGNSIDGNIILPADKLDEVLASVIKSYKAWNEDEATSWGKIDESNFPTDLESELEMAGFDFERDGENEFVILSWGGKWRMYIGALLNGLTDHAIGDSRMAFVGEDGALWRWTPERGLQDAKISWE